MSPYAERHKFAGYSIEVHGTTGGYYWSVVSHMKITASGRAWRRKTAWNRGYKAAERLQGPK